MSKDALLWEIEEDYDVDDINVESLGNMYNLDYFSLSVEEF